jgi:Asp-tRNA(Asn)/Glu-tRNA(Gln) amidotransferase A subunit family amidase
MKRLYPVISFSVVLILALSAEPSRSAQPWRFHLEEATIADVHRAIRGRQLTATQLVNHYFKRIEAYNGTCVKGDVDPNAGLMLAAIEPIENAGQLNAYITLNLRGRRSKTDTVDNDPKHPDALEVAKAQDAYFARTGKFVGPLHGIPLAIKDVFDTIDLRTTGGAAAPYANDKAPTDATIVAKLRAAGAIILGKANTDEYAAASIGRSGFGGQTCNPYDTTRVPGGSSGGSGAAVAANLAMCALGTDTSGSVRSPASANNVVGMLGTQGLISRAGIMPLSFSRDRGGPLCRTVQDTALIMEVIAGYDPRDQITTPAYNRPAVAYSRHANKKFLAGKRLGVVRELMAEATLADRDSVRVASEAIADLKKLGATIVDPVNFHDAIAELVPYLEPSLLTQQFKSLAPAGVNPIDHAVSIAADPKLMPGGPRGVNLRAIAGPRRGDEGKYGINRYLRERGDPKFKNSVDMFAAQTFAGNQANLRNQFSPDAKTLDTPAHTNHTLRRYTLQQILLKVMADNKLDALIFPYSTIPAHPVLVSREPAHYNTRTEPRNLKAGTELSNPDFLPGEQTLKTDIDLNRGAGGSWGVNLSPLSGFPTIVVPAGFTREIYDRVADAKDPNGSVLVGPIAKQLPVNMEFLGRPFDEANLFEIASAYEAGTKHRRPPKGFGPLRGEP